MTHCYELDGLQMQTPEQAHTYLKLQLNLPDYYGMNRDALFDCLTELHKETIFWISDADKINSEIMHVLEQASTENLFLTVIFSD